jgi:dolichol-phosphate mannosyltransferase
MKLSQSSINSKDEKISIISLPNESVVHDDFFISIVIPVMNEEGNIQLISSKVIDVLSIYKKYEIIFVDDGSTDNTLPILENLNKNNKNIKFLSFSRNFGHQNALKAGLDYTKGDCVISLDGDMQHPPELIPEMINKWKRDGYDIVYTVRKDDPNQGFFKKISSRLFYKFLNYIADTNITAGSADFRLLDKSVVDIIRQFKESPLFFRGLIPWIGFKQIAIEYMPNQRLWGKSKYSLKKMFDLALTGILGFSIKPLLISIYIGIFISAGSFFYGCYVILIKIFTTKTISGWASMVAAISFIGGIQLIILGMMGMYLGKLFMESKGRPSYIISKKS